MDKKVRKYYQSEKEARDRYRKTEKGKLAQARYMKKWRLLNPVKWKENHSASMRKMKYGLTKNCIDKRILNQNGSCAICSDPFVNGYFHVDHCHESGKVRGLLCRTCNTVLGRFQDSIPRFNSAIEYLRAGR